MQEGCARTAADCDKRISETECWTGMTPGHAACDLPIAVLSKVPGPDLSDVRKHSCRASGTL